jgi:hypothetical protein
MDSDPGSKLDFSTFIAYLLPGYIIAFYFFSFLDLLYLLQGYWDYLNHFSDGTLSPDGPLPPLHKSLILPFTSLDTGKAALLVAVSLVIAYFAGLVFDICAHTRTLEDELRHKRSAYQDSFRRFSSLLKNESLKTYLNAAAVNAGINEVASKFVAAAQKAVEAATAAAAKVQAAAKPTSGTAISAGGSPPGADANVISAADASTVVAWTAVVAQKAAEVAQSVARFAGEVVKPSEAANNLEAFVDAIFYTVASSQVWARVNWIWAFYEAARQLTTLTQPRYIWVIFLYIGLTLVDLFSRDLDPLWRLTGALIITAVLSLLSWWLIHRPITIYLSQICRAYHRHRADFVFGHLIQSELIEHQNVSMELRNITRN